MSRPRREPALSFVLLTVLLDAIGIGLIIPVLPALVGQLTVGPDAQAYWYGAITATFGLAQFLCAPLLGALSDRWGRRPVILLGIAGLGINFLATAFAASPWVLLASRVVGGAMSANLAVANAYVADITPADQRSKRFGLLGAAFGVGFIVGPVIGGLLGALDVRWPFFAAAGLCALNGLYGLLVLPESLPRERRTRRVPWSGANPFASMRALAQLKSVGSLVAVIALSNLAQFVLYTVWVLYTTYRFGWGPRENGISLFVVGVTAAVTQGMLLGRVIGRLGAPRTATWGLASGALAFVAYGFATQSWMMIAIVIVNALSYCVAPALQGVVSSAAPPDRQGATMGGVTSLTSLMSVLAPLLAAPLFAGVSHLAPNDWRVGAPFFLSAALQCAALLIARRHFGRAAFSVPQRA